MKYLSILLIWGVLICVNPVHASNGSKKTADIRGNSALLNEDVGDFKKIEKTFTLLLNTANSSLNGTYLWESPEKLPAKFGIDLGGKAANGVSSLFEAFESGENASEFMGKVFMTFPLGKVNDETNCSSTQRMMIELGMYRGSYNFVEKVMSTDSDEAGTGMAEAMPAITDEISVETHTLPSMFVYYNRNIRSNLLAGISVGWLRMNNYASLESLQVVKSEPAASADSSPATETNIVQSRQTARIGDYEDFNALQVSTDVLFVPNINLQPVAFNLFFRYTFRDGRKDLFEPGFGIFKMKEGPSPNKTKEDLSANPDAKKEIKTTEAPKDTEAFGGPSGTTPRNTPGLERRDLPWKIVYGIVGQWDDDIEEFRFGVVAGYNF